MSGAAGGEATESETVRTVASAPTHDGVSPVAQRGLRRVAEAPLVEGNAAELLMDGPAVYPAMLEMIRSAERWIHFENYIVRDDEIGREFADTLAERARAGLRVRILYDWFGSFMTPNSFWDELRKAGCEVRAWGRPSQPSMGLVQRDHRKLLVTDRGTAVVAGLCVGSEWTGSDAKPCWRDTGVRLEGPIARELERSFSQLWRGAGGTAPERSGSPRPGRAGAVAARVVEGEPFKARAYRFYELMAALAERNLYLTGAYPLTPAPLRRALGSAARGGVDVRLLVPAHSNWIPIDNAARMHYGSLLRAGVRIYEWAGPMLHAKTMVADTSLALIGSSNLNPFSLLGNYELDVEIQHAGLAHRMEEQFRADLENAREITPSEWERRPSAQRWRERFSGALLWLPYKLYSA